jgi:hypothetical protein
MSASSSAVKVEGGVPLNTCPIAVDSMAQNITERSSFEWPGWSGS